MLKRVRTYFSPPTFTDPIKTQHAHALTSILISLILGILVWICYPILFQKWIYLFACLLVILLLVMLFLLTKRGQIDFVRKALPLFLWITAFSAIAASGGIRSYFSSILALVIIIAYLLLGEKTGLLYITMTLVAGAIISVFENLGLIPNLIPESNFLIFAFIGFTFLQVGLIMTLVTRSLDKYQGLSVASEGDHEELITTLEKYRQDFLQNSNVLEQQNIKLEIITELTQLAIEENTEEGFLDRVITLTINKLNFDHIGIFLIDNLQENMVLIKTNSQEGKNLLAKNYKLKISDNPLVTPINEAETIKVRFGKNTSYLTQPVTLPESKSNISVPVATSEKLFGLINMQSYAPDPWMVDDEITQAIANHVALVLDNFRLMEELYIRMHELSHLAGDVTQTAWKEITRGRTIGYQYDHLHILPQKETFPNDVRSALEARKVAQYNIDGVSPSSRLVAPIILRDQVIGVIGYEDVNPSHEWTSSEVTILETIASRVSLAIENSRLVSEAEQRAENEQFIGQISAHIRETLDFETILQTALQDLQGKFDLHEAEIRLKNEGLES